VRERGSICTRLILFLLAFTIAASLATLPGEEEENLAPVAAADSYYVLEGRILEVPVPGVLANDSDPEGKKLIARLFAPPKSGSLTLESDGSFIYEHDDGFIGADSFLYTASDGISGSEEILVDMTVCKIQTANLILSEVEINPAGTDTGMEWVEIFNPNDHAVDLFGWTVTRTYKVKQQTTIAELPTQIEANGYIVYEYPELSLRNSPLESLQLLDPDGALVDETPLLSDESNDERTWQRIPTGVGDEWEIIWVLAPSTKKSENRPL